MISSGTAKDRRKCLVLEVLRGSLGLKICEEPEPGGLMTSGYLSPTRLRRRSRTSPELKEFEIWLALAKL